MLCLLGAATLTAVVGTHAAIWAPRVADEMGWIVSIVLLVAAFGLAARARYAKTG